MTALGDGRIAVLVPPHSGNAGTLTVVDGAASRDVSATRSPSLPLSHPLILPKEPLATVTEFRRGLWLDSFEERAPGVLGGWVEAGGPLVGVEVDLHGQVTAGEVRDDAGMAVACGRFAVSLIEGGRAAETSDGGKTWTELPLPERDDEARAFPTRGCSPAGASLPGWARVGWGETSTADDMMPTQAPKSKPMPLKVTPGLTFTCGVISVATPPPAESPRTAPKTAGVPAPRRGHGGSSNRSAAPPPSREAPAGWASFRNTPPPPLVDGDYGIDNGTGPEIVQLHAYAWGRRGADWTRAGRWLVRFDDRFDASGGVRSTALSASPWNDETLAGDALGSGGSYGATGWTGFLDPSGRAALASACHGSGCALFAAVEGAPVLPLREPSGKLGSYLRPLGRWSGSGWGVLVFLDPERLRTTRSSGASTWACPGKSEATIAPPTTLATRARVSCDALAPTRLGFSLSDRQSPASGAVATMLFRWTSNRASSARLSCWTGGTLWMPSRLRRAFQPVMPRTTAGCSTLPSTCHPTSR